MLRNKKQDTRNKTQESSIKNQSNSARFFFLASCFLFLASYHLILPAAYAGTLSGSVTFTGTIPEKQAISMDADPTCSSFHSGPVYDESVLVSDGKLKNVFVYIKEGLKGKTFEVPSEKVVLDQAGCRYEPHVFGIQVGQVLEILNSDATLHNVHGMPKQSKEFNLGMPIKGMKLKRKFDAPEIAVTFKCDVHPWMRAYAGVTTHPFFSVSSEDGSFTIENLPAGSYTLEAWHEKFGTKTQHVTLDAAGTTTINFEF